MTQCLQEFRCPNCHKLLFKGLLENEGSVVEIKCKSCKELNNFQGCCHKDAIMTPEKVKMF